MSKFNACKVMMAILILSACTAMLPSPVPTPTSTLPPMIEFDYGDGGLISDMPCAAPCFLGITPGDDIESVVNSLENLGIDAYCQWRTQRINCPGFSIELRPDEQTVWYIQFGTSDPDLEFGSSAIHLADVLEKYGEPAWVDIAIIVEMDIVYPSQLELCYDNPFMLIFLESQDSERPYNATPWSRVQCAIYGNGTCGSSGRHLQWHGYGEYWFP
jgi:hypothetical protein